VRQLDGDRGADQLGVSGVAGVAGQQHQRGPEALAAGGDQVAGGLLHERVGGDHRVPQGLLDLDEARPDLRLDPGQASVRRGAAVGGAHYPRILSAVLAALTSTSGARPMATVSTPASPRARPRAGARPTSGSVSPAGSCR
jgi:hypothetical protein